MDKIKLSEIKGVTIISKEEIVETELKRWVAIVIGVYFISIIILAIVIENILHILTGVFSLSLIWSIVIIPLICQIASKHVTNKIHTGKYRYVVRIDKEASFVELTKSFNISKYTDNEYLVTEK